MEKKVNGREKGKKDRRKEVKQEGKEGQEREIQSE